MAKTNPIGVRFREDVLEYVKREHGIESPQKALVFYERFFVQHSALAKEVKSPLRIAEPDKKEEESVIKAAEMPQNSQIQARIAELEKEITSPPKNPLIGLKMWLQIRQSELNKLKTQLNQ